MSDYDHLAELLRHPENPIVFMEMTAGGAPIGTIKMELFADVCPKTAENFRQFCTGEYRRDGVPVGYKNAQFHRVIQDFMIQGGDFVNGDGTGMTSIYGSKFRDESFELDHSEPGILSMANAGPDTNGCQFFITCAKCDFLDKKHVVFGRVLDGLLTVRKIENVPTGQNNKPKIPIVITQCGQLSCVHAVNTWAETSQILLIVHEMEFIVLLGEGAVGKTSVMVRYVENKFSTQHVSTLQASFLSKKLYVDGKTVDLDIWDTAGQEKFHALGPIYYRSSHGALLIYDITDVHSFEKVKMWVNELKRMLGDEVYLIIIGNKLDLERNRNVDKNEATEYARSIDAGYFETSAKDNIGVIQAFDHLVKGLIERANLSSLEGVEKMSHYGTRGRSDLLVTDDAAPDKKFCCFI
ncbi:unnamed protein product [Thelazia callipaeda]|uniref:Peptidyl-prolyl cis-trans isomerase H n=1 Tax=Thelazia callipaeda TaxID=103827 RepID=A0A0N5D111_THECL|nr:unnamed protein product [Thelazia callipaeda]